MTEEKNAVPDSETPSSNPLSTAVSFAAEATVPGLSHVAKGDLKSGVTYGIAGLAATMIFGLPGRLLVGASSFLKATSGTDLVAALRQPADRS